MSTTSKALKYANAVKNILKGTVENLSPSAVEGRYKASQMAKDNAIEGIAQSAGYKGGTSEWASKNPELANKTDMLTGLVRKIANVIGNIKNK